MDSPVEKQTAVVKNTIPASPEHWTQGGLASRAGGVLFRVVITLLLIPIFVALIIEAIKLDGIAAPVLGR